MCFVAFPTIPSIFGGKRPSKRGAFFLFFFVTKGATFTCVAPVRGRLFAAVVCRCCWEHKRNAHTHSSMGYWLSGVVGVAICSRNAHRYCEDNDGLRDLNDLYDRVLRTGDHEPSQVAVSNRFLHQWLYW